MKILLTGACGRVGKATIEQAGRDHELVLFDLDERVKQQGGMHADVLDLEALRTAAHGCQAIIHTAAVHGGFRNRLSNQEFLRQNLLGAENIFQVALEQGIKRLVFSSTLEVLCGGDYNGYGPVVYTEDLPPRPDWIYPTTKFLIEEMGKIYAYQHGLSVVQLRYSWVRNVPLRTIGVGLLARAIAGSDVGRANLLAATRPGLAAHILNIGPSSPLTQTDINLGLSDPWAPLERYWPGCRPVLEAAGYQLESRDLWPVCRLDNARAVLGWQPRITFDHLLAELGYQSPAPALVPTPAAIGNALQETR